MGDGSVEEFGGKKYLWGNMPAYDVLKLDNNEGLSYKGPLSLLFAGNANLPSIPSTIPRRPGLLLTRLLQHLATSAIS